MKLVLSSLLFVIFASTLVVGYVLFPDILLYRDCYKRLEDKAYQKGQMFRRTYKNEEELCMEVRNYLVDTGLCFAKADAALVQQEYRAFSEYFGKVFAFADHELEPMVEEHNTECSFRSTRIDPEEDFVIEP